MFALSESDFQVAIERINDFAMTVLSQFHSNTYEGKRLHMLNTALFPIASSMTLGPEKNVDGGDACLGHTTQYQSVQSEAPGNGDLGQHE